MGRTDLRTYVVEALDWMLPNATKPEESIVVLLDWYSGHLTDAVAELVRRKGHVLLFHGGGCTPFTQVNDTHLHARLQQLLTQTEIDWAHKERQRLLSIGSNKTPTMTREEILSIVQEAWLGTSAGRCLVQMWTPPRMACTLTPWGSWYTWGTIAMREAQPGGASDGTMH